MRDDLELHRYLADRQPPLPIRLPPPQVMTAGDMHSHEIDVVFASSGKRVPWLVTYINCSDGYLMRYRNKASHGNDVIREDGDFRVVWQRD